MPDYDFLIIGSGFGGSVSALRLVEKGYRVLMLEKGRRLQGTDFPRTNWDVKRWLWLPRLGFRGLFKMTFLPHVTALSGVGVGGGSLVYANTLPIPRDDYFASSSWARLSPDWKAELLPHYHTARRMLGAALYPRDTLPDQVLREVARDLGREHAFEKATVAVYFGEQGRTVTDPYFGGEGPSRTGCIHCGGCMLGCRHDAKNTLDKNYLFFAEKKGLELRADTEVTDVVPLDGAAGETGYRVTALEGASQLGRARRQFTAGQVIFAGGVLGTVDLLMRLKEKGSLSGLSPRLGEFVRTNSEVLMGVVTRRAELDMSDGVAITSIVHTDEHSHLEPVRYPHGAGFFRTLMSPHAPGRTLGGRLLALVKALVRHPVAALRAFFVSDWARYTLILLYMRTIDGSLRMRLGRSLRTLFTRGLLTEVGTGPAPEASIPEATELGERVAAKIDGFPASMLTETLLGVPTTAHILGGCTMGESADRGVIDARHRVHGYQGLYVIDGSAISANPGVNPSLSICALAERAMTFIPPRPAEGSGTPS